MSLKYPGPRHRAQPNAIRIGRGGYKGFAPPSGRFSMVPEVLRMCVKLVISWFTCRWSPRWTEDMQVS